MVVKETPDIDVAWLVVGDALRSFQRGSARACSDAEWLHSRQCVVARGNNIVQRTLKEVGPLEGAELHRVKEALCCVFPGEAGELAVR